LPFHRPITGTKAVPVLDAKLTALQADAEEQATLSGVPAVTAAGCGYLCVLHRLPFQRSAMATLVSALFQPLPTAKQAVAAGQETLLKPVGGLLVGVPVGVCCAVQAEPFHRTTSGRVSPRRPSGTACLSLYRSEPTAVQAEADEQEMADKLADVTPLGSGNDCRDHLVPSRRSISGMEVAPICWEPTARHILAEAQATPDNELMASFRGAGVASIVQALPSHRSTSGGRVSSDVRADPTAVHARAEAQETASRLSLSAPAGLGVGRVVHSRPVHCSASVAAIPVAACWLPTATHASVEEQETASRLLVVRESRSG
jgi:hypothetical protein